jgi:hypothetical protein
MVLSGGHADGAIGGSGPHSLGVQGVLVPAAGVPAGSLVPPQANKVNTTRARAATVLCIMTPRKDGTRRSLHDALGAEKVTPCYQESPPIGCRLHDAWRIAVERHVGPGMRIRARR